MNKIWVFLAFMVFGCTAQNHDMAHGHGGHHNESSLIIRVMHAPMGEYIAGGSIEGDYVVNMIPHHQGAIDSSKLLLSQTTNPTLQKIARNIIKTQAQEIGDFKALLAKGFAKSPDDVYKNVLDASKRAHDEMMKSMNNIASTNPDMDFIVGMIAHHRAAIDSSKIVLEYSTNEAVRNIARNIISEQSKEIDVLNELLHSMH